MDRFHPRAHGRASVPARAHRLESPLLGRIRGRADIRDGLRRLSRVAAFFVCGGLFVTACSRAQDYAMSLSASPTDPGVNHVSELCEEEFDLYLWLTCSTGAGASAFEGVVVTNYLVVGFEPTTGLLARWSTPEHPALALEGCNQPPMLLGRWRMRNVSGETSGSVCLGLPWLAGPSCAVADCFVLAGIPDVVAGVTGFAVGDDIPCIASNGCEDEH